MVSYTSFLIPSFTTEMAGFDKQSVRYKPNVYDISLACFSRSNLDTMKRRRTFLGSAMGVVTLLAGCSSDSGNGTDTQTPEVETLEVTDTAPTTTSTGQPNDEGTESQVEDTATPEPTVEFNAMLNDVSKCGLTCREIKYTLQNRGQLSANQVTVGIQVHTGGDQVYDATQSIGDLQSRTQKAGITRQIDVGIGGGNKIQNNNGEITLTLTPESESGVSENFTFDRTLDV